MALARSVGNMYGWVSHMHSHIRGACEHKCKYCYVKSTAAGRCGMYDGELEISERALKKKLWSERIEREAKERGFVRPMIFIDHMNDLWAKGVPDEWIGRVLEHCKEDDRSDYVFQTKNPGRYADWFEELPGKMMIGSTVETDIDEVGKEAAPGAPLVSERIKALEELDYFHPFVTIEPVLRCNPERFAELIAGVKPWFVTLGADSKGHGLDEPSAEELGVLVDELEKREIRILVKNNLGRIWS